MKKALLLSLISLTSTFAFADQCAYLTKSEAQKAVRAVIDSNSVQALCEPCGERRAQSVSVESVSLKKIDAQNFQVFINDKGIDLAYTYVNGLNLAKLVGCKTSDVSPAIK